MFPPSIRYFHPATDIQTFNPFLSHQNLHPRFGSARPHRYCDSNIHRIPCAPLDRQCSSYPTHVPRSGPVSIYHSSNNPSDNPTNFQPQIPPLRARSSPKILSADFSTPLFLPINLRVTANSVPYQSFRSSNKFTDLRLLLSAISFPDNILRRIFSIPPSFIHNLRAPSCAGPLCAGPASLCVNSSSPPLFFFFPRHSDRFCICHRATMSSLPKIPALIAAFTVPGNTHDTYSPMPSPY